MLTREIELSILYEITNISSQLSEVREILDIGLDKATRVLGSEIAVFYVMDQESGMLTRRAASGIRLSRTREQIPLLDDDLILNTINWSQTHGKPFPNDPLMGEYPLHTALGLPIRSGTTLLGWLFVARLQGDAFTSSEVSLFGVLASRIGSALELALTRERDREQQKALTEANRKLAQMLAELTLTHERQNVLLKELQIAKQAAEAANELKSRFLANMSHELRTPLNAILNFTRFLGDPEVSGQLNQQQEMLQHRVLANAEHLLGLINDLLDLSKIEAGKMELFNEAVDMHFLLKGVLSTAIGLTKDKELELTLTIPDALPKVWGDKTRIRQIMLNLLSNAAKFTERGGITVRVEDTADGFLTIAVADTGIGIKPEDQVRVFEEFTQAESELSRQHQGTGLGLPICRKLVAMHHGRMWMQSEPDHGSTFFVSLPLASTEGIGVPGPSPAGARGAPADH